MVHCDGKVVLCSFSTTLPWLPSIMLNFLTKSSFDISLLFKLKYAAILLLSYIMDCELTRIHKNDLFKKKATFVRSGIDISGECQ